MPIPESWPAALQNTVDSGTFDTVDKDLRIKSTLKNGPTQLRRDSAAVITTINVGIWVDSTEYVALETFYRTTLLGGSQPFKFYHPITALSVLWRFADIPTYRPVGPRLFLAKFHLRNVVTRPPYEPTGFGLTPSDTNITVNWSNSFDADGVTVEYRLIGAL